MQLCTIRQLLNSSNQINFYLILEIEQKWPTSSYVLVTMIQNKTKEEEARYLNQRV